MPREDLLAPLQDSGYLFDSYQAASSLLREESPQSVSSAAAILCDALITFARDQAFWAAVIDLLPEIEGRREELDALHEDVVEFLAVEVEVLANRGYDVKTARRLVSDVDSAVILVGEAHSGRSVENLRSSLDRLRNATCLQTTEVMPAAPEARGRRVMRILRVAKRGLLVVGGGALVVVNGVAFVHGALDGATTLASARHGLTALTAGLLAEPA